MKKILIVDDERLICEEFKDILSEDGHEVDICFNGPEALVKVQEKEYDLVFLDVLMPRMEGREVFDRIQKIRKTPVAIMSGYLPANKEKEVLSLGAVACFRKPLELSRIKSLIKSLDAPQS